MNLPAQSNSDYHAVIIRAAADPTFDVEKLARLVELQREIEERAANEDFNIALASAEQEMGVINADANNPQTKSRYATLARLDGAIRPIYTAKGFSVSYDTEPGATADEVTIIAYLSHGKVTRKHKIGMPIDTTGLRGQQAMTKTHAKMSAVTYGRRVLLTMCFHLTIDNDDDGNRAGGYPSRQQHPQQEAPPPPPPPSAEPLHDPKTGEILGPHEHKRAPDEAWLDWVRPLLASISTAKTEAVIDEWLKLNEETLAQFKAQNSPMFLKFEATVNRLRNDVKLATKEKSDDTGATQ